MVEKHEKLSRTCLKNVKMVECWKLIIKDNNVREFPKEKNY
jgi:hypothetical protein